MHTILSKLGRHRHQLLRRAEARVPEQMRLRTVEQLRSCLQTAIELEHATIPVYLTALYSIRPGTNDDAAQILRSVVMEEMLHLILAANVLNAIGGRPQVNKPEFVPTYPTYLPHSDDAFLIPLARFSPSAVHTFLSIEKPKPHNARPEATGYDTIGQFYEAIELGLIDLAAEGNLFTGDPHHQITPEFYYGGGGEVVVVGQDPTEAPLDAALRALREIVGQGEGVSDTVWDGDEVEFGQEVEPAHYFRFNQIHAGRFYQEGDTPTSGPTGRPLSVDWSGVFPMRANPKLADLIPHSGAWQISKQFNEAYSRLLDVIHVALNGRPRHLLESVPRMYELKYLATALMQVPLPDSDETAGPSFEFTGHR